MAGQAPEGSIARRDASRPNLLVFEIKDKIPKADIEWMSEIVDRAFDVEGEVDMLLIMTNYEGSDLGAVFDGEAIGVQSRSLAHVRRYCVVGAPAWAKAMIAVSGAITPVETKTFELEEEEAAWRWVDESLN